ncbi:hypothetical protein BDZ89DRAFT_1048468 [Hymenopellis radicata]|nr:hypothetical protein BDZ89DRAFT_1048468 [Hymenopellis radicata]
MPGEHPRAMARGHSAVHEDGLTAVVVRVPSHPLTIPNPSTGSHWTTTACYPSRTHQPTAAAAPVSKHDHVVLSADGVSSRTTTTSTTISTQRHLSSSPTLSYRTPEHRLTSSLDDNLLTPASNHGREEDEAREFNDHDSDNGEQQPWQQRRRYQSASTTATRVRNTRFWIIKDALISRTTWGLRARRHGDCDHDGMATASTTTRLLHTANTDTAGRRPPAPRHGDLELTIRRLPGHGDLKPAPRTPLTPPSTEDYKRIRRGHVLRKSPPQALAALPVKADRSPEPFCSSPMREYWLCCFRISPSMNLWFCNTFIHFFGLGIQWCKPFCNSFKTGGDIRSAKMRHTSTRPCDFMEGFKRYIRMTAPGPPGI